MLALAIAFYQGTANTGWSMATTRLLFVSIVPDEQKTEYLSLRYAWMGLVGGISPLLAGWLLDRGEGAGGRFLALTIDPYTPLFLASLVLLLLALCIFRRVRADNTFSVRDLLRLALRKRRVRT